MNRHLWLWSVAAAFVIGCSDEAGVRTAMKNGTGGNGGSLGQSGGSLSSGDFALGSGSGSSSFPGLPGTTAPAPEQPQEEFSNESANDVADSIADLPAASAEAILGYLWEQAAACNFLAGATAEPFSSCGNSSQGEECVNAILNVGDFFLYHALSALPYQFPGTTVSDMQRNWFQAQAMCASLDLSDPEEIYESIKTTQKQCQKGNYLSCILNRMLIVKHYLRFIIEKVFQSFGSSL